MNATAMRKQKKWCIGLVVFLAPTSQAHDKRCDGSPYGDSAEAVASYQSNSDNPLFILKQACNAKFSRADRAQFYSVGITDVFIEEHYSVDIATEYLASLRIKLRESASATTIVDFALDGKQLAEKGTFLTLSGEYIKQGNAETLYTNTQAVLQSSYSAASTPPPSVPLLTEDASREFRKHLLACQAHPTYAQVGCHVTIWGHAKICTQTSAFGVTRNLPCIHVVDGQ